MSVWWFEGWNRPTTPPFLKGNTHLPQGQVPYWTVLDIQPKTLGLEQRFIIPAGRVLVRILGRAITQPYCWWLKSCTPGMYKNLVNNGINYLSTGAGFQPSTVTLINSKCFIRMCHRRFSFGIRRFFIIISEPFNYLNEYGSQIRSVRTNYLYI